MKKILFTLVALLSMTFAMAQSTDNASEKKHGGKHGDPKEMIQKRTQEMVEKYGLSTDQATKLQTLNEKYMKMGPGGPRPGGMKDGERPEPPKDMQQGDNSGQSKEMKDGERPEPPKGGQHGGKGMSDEDFQKQMQEYDEGIKAILTDDQYKAYKADQEKRDAERKSKKGQKKSE